MPSSDDVEQLRQDHPGMAAHLPPVGGTDGPDQGNPAAWAMREHDGRLTAATTDPRRAESWRTGPWVDDHGRRRERATTVVGLYLRAPGAVAAAPPGDEVAVSRADLRAVLDLVETYDEGCLANTAPETERLAAALAVPPAPPAGHEDEAAVERAARDEVENRHHIHGEWCLCGFRSAVARDRTVHILDALAAARGPRTPDRGAGA